MYVQLLCVCSATDLIVLVKGQNRKPFQERSEPITRRVTAWERYVVANVSFKTTVTTLLKGGLSFSS